MTESLIHKYNELTETHEYIDTISLYELFTLINRVTGDTDLIYAAGYDSIFLNLEPDDLALFSDSEILKLVESGVYWNRETESFVIWI